MTVKEIDAWIEEDTLAVESLQRRIASLREHRAFLVLREREAGNEPASDENTPSAPPVDLWGRETPPETKRKKAAVDTKPVPFKEIVAAFHELCPSLKRLRLDTPARRQLVMARWRGEFRSDMEVVRRFFVRVEASDFLAGRTKPRYGHAPWMATFDWLMRQDNAVKIIEGRYDNAH